MKAIECSMYFANGEGNFKIWINDGKKEILCSQCDKPFLGYHRHKTKSIPMPIQNFKRTIGENKK